MKSALRLRDTLTAITISPAKELIKLNRHLASLTRAFKFSEALDIFRQIHSSYHLRPDQFSFSTALTASANRYDTASGNQLHANAIRAGFRNYPHVANTLLLLYAKSQDLTSVKRVFGEIQNPDIYSWTTLLSACMKLGDIDYAWEMFDQRLQTDTVVWNAMITGCLEHGYYELATSLFRRMHELGVRHDNYSFASVLSFLSLELFNFGRQVHSLAIKTGYLAKASVINALITMYYNCGSSLDACIVFEEAGNNIVDQITYNVMISSLANTGRKKEAIMMFKDMLRIDLRPTELTFISVMSSCGHKEVATQVHGLALKIGFADSTSFSNAAITIYARCGDLRKASCIFETLNKKDIVSWNVIVTSYAQRNLGSKAISAYIQMQRGGIDPDEFTIGSLLMSSNLLVTVEMILVIAFKQALIVRTEVCNALLSALFRHGETEKASNVFSGMHMKNLISWNALISGLSFNGYPEKSLWYLMQMVKEGFTPNIYTLSLLVGICAGTSKLNIGKQIHGYILRYGLHSETVLGNSLISLYAKCGKLDGSLSVFKTMMNKDVVSWNSMISSYAQHGKGREAVKCFEAMQGLTDVQPDKATFTSILSACSHAGLVDDAMQIFNSMVNHYNIEPGIDHFSCMVDLLGRAGYLDIAEGILNKKHIGIDSNVCWTLLSSAVTHGNLRLAKLCAEFLLKTEWISPTLCVLLSNINASEGKWEESANIRDLMRKCWVTKAPGSSWIKQ